MDNNVDVPYEIEYVAVKPCKCFPNNLTLCRIHPLNLLSPGFPEYCDNLKCSTQISLENPVNTSAYVESLQIQFNTFQTKLGDVIHLKMPYEKRELIPFDGDAKKISFFTLDSPKFVLNFTTNEVGIDTGFNITIKYIKRNRECLCHGTDRNLKILDGKKISAQYTFDGKKCTFMDCFWEIEPPKHAKFYHRLIVKFNLTLADKNGEFVEVCPKNFDEKNNDCQRHF
uniref:Uncharacterized protein n=1 Tax=Meloidogyne enterolobii TaxID=390850 RepID=A0A6V7VQT1_MELEN|nr:unnamed protein product [Meloidogyne enterolobii]